MDLEKYSSQTLLEHYKNKEVYVEKFLDLAKTLLADKKYGESLHLLNVVLDIDIFNQEVIELIKKVVLERQNVSLGDLLILDGYIDDFGLSLSIANGFLANREYEKAWTYYLKCSRLAKTDVDKFQLFFNIGSYYFSQSNHKNALIYFKKCLPFGLEQFKTLNMIACIYIYNGLAKKAINLLEKCLELPDCDEGSVYMNLGLPLAQLRRFKESREANLKALEYNPENVLAYQNILLDSNYDPDLSPQEIFELHKKIDDYLKPGISLKILDEIKGKKNKKVGIISADLVNHPVSFFIKTLIEKKEDLVIFSNGSYKNDKRKVYQIECLSDEQLEELILREEIDVLIDLSVCTGRNRMSALKNKPVPCIINFLGYPNTSGSRIYDYRLVDRITDNEGSLMTEQPLYFDNCFLCYDYSHLSEFKLERKSKVKTFFSNNRQQKLNEKVLKLYRRVLDANEGSRIVFKNKELINRDNRDYILQFIPADRCSFINFFQNQNDAYKFMNSVDILLDCFPYNGTTTTCDALSVGVPVITLKGEDHRSSVSSSILINSDLSEYVATSEDEFVEISKKPFPDKQEISRKFRENYVCNKELWYENFCRLIEEI